MDKLDLLVIIANYNGTQDTNDCIDSIQMCSPSIFEFKILIVDNSDEEPFPERSGIEIIRPGRNLGLAGAWREGYAVAVKRKADYCLYMNNDVYVAKDIFEQLSISIMFWGKNNVFGARIYFYDQPDVIWSRGGSVNKWFVMVKHFGFDVDGKMIAENDFETGHISGCFIMIPVQALNSIGGPDESFFFRGEEWDLNYRLGKAGVRLIVSDRAKLWHKINRSHNRFHPRMLYFTYRSKVLFARKHQPLFWFPIWFCIAILYAAFFSPGKFLKISHQNIFSSEYLKIQKALIKGLFDGVCKKRIEESDYS